MKKLIFALIAVCATAVIAEEQKTDKPQLTEAEKAERRQKMLEKTGGIIEKKGDGKIVFIDCQTRIDEKEIAERVDKIARVLRYNCEIRKGSWKFGDGVPADANIAIYLVDDEKLPMSLVAVEAHWGVVNTATLKLGTRFSKELTRVFTLVAGAAQSQVKTSAMQPIVKSSDLDRVVTDGFTFDMANAVISNLKALGVTRGIKTSYRKACMDGWAPAPTNDFQKVVWEEVHAKPTNPMKIKFDPKKGE